MRMIDGDALMAKLNRKKAGPANKKYIEGFNDCLMRVRSMVHSEPTLTPQNEWVSVEDRLPEQENTQVLMTDGECHYISSRNNMVRFLDCEGIFIPGKAGAGVKVTHWMPLPAPTDRRPPEGEA